MTTRRSALRVALAHSTYTALFGLACVVALPTWMVRAWRDRRQVPWLRGRLGRLPDGAPGGRPAWIHAVSVGEVKAARPLVAQLRATQPDVPLVISTGTPTGYETARAAFPDLYVFHAPLDLPWVVRNMVRRIDPRVILLLELEVWPSFLRVADEHGVPQAILNARVTRRSYDNYRRTHWWVPEFDRLALVAAQDDDQARRIASLGVPADRVHVTGNLKHELAGAPDGEAVAALGRELGLNGEQPVIVAGSTHPGEEEMVARAWGAVPGSQLVIVPRHVERVRDIERALDRAGVAHVRRSRAAPGRDPATIVLVDTMGELERLFALADVVFLGGSLVAVGGHNVLEPAAAGRPVLVGPHLESCRAEARVLADAGGLAIVADEHELASRLADLVGDAAARAAMGDAAERAARGLRGAAAQDVELLVERGLLREPAR